MVHTSWSCVNSTIISSTIAEPPITRWTGVVFVSAAQSTFTISLIGAVHAMDPLQSTRPHEQPDGALMG